MVRNAGGHRGVLLRDVGESGLIELFRGTYGGVARTGELPIGDDAAVVRVPGGRAVLSTDLLVEGTHFSLVYFRPEEVGRRALSANLSDLAAMGADPSATWSRWPRPRGLPWRRSTRSTGA